MLPPMTLIAELRNVGRVALDLVYPPVCGVCGRPGAFVCPACVDALPRTQGTRCDVCWLPLRGVHCYGCASRPLPLEMLRAPFRYEGDVRHIVRAFKFGGQSSLAPLLGVQLSEAYEDHHFDVDLIVPVPLTSARKRWRGYDQALLLARELGRLQQLPVVEALRRRGNAVPQAESSGVDQRLRNVQGVFSVSKPETVGGQRVLLIDDVATTCATLSACALELMNAGASGVLALTVARED
jgi:ComF family protein